MSENTIVFDVECPNGRAYAINVLSDALGSSVAGISVVKEGRNYCPKATIELHDYCTGLDVERLQQEINPQGVRLLPVLWDEETEEGEPENGVLDEETINPATIPITILNIAAAA